MRSTMSFQFALLAVALVCSSSLPSIFAYQKNSVVGIFENNQQICTGVLLSNKHVLGSSNCFINPDQDIGKLRVVLTEQNVENSQDAGSYAVESISEQYQNDHVSESFHTINIGMSILHLAHPAPFKGNVHKACILEKDVDLNTNKAFVMQTMAMKNSPKRVQYPFAPIVQNWFDAPKYTSVVPLAKELKSLPICSKPVICTKIEIREYLEKRVCSAELGAPLVKREANRDLVAGLLSFVQMQSKSNPVLRTLQVEPQTCPMNFIFVKPTDHLSFIKRMVKEDLCVV